MHELKSAAAPHLLLVPVGVIAVVCWVFPLRALATNAPSLARSARPRAATRGDLADANWSVDASPNFSVKPPRARSVDEFLRRHVESYGGDPANILCSFTFANLRHDGFLSLVAGTGVKDAPSCEYLYIVDRTPKGFKLYWSAGAIGAGANVRGSIRDLRRNGRLELVLSESIGHFGPGCQATFPAIYAWTGKNYTDVSGQFKGFFRDQLKSIERKIAAIRPVRTSTGSLWEPPEKECLLADASALKRFLGMSPEAGLDQAIRLSSSKDPFERAFAVDLLGAIGGQAADRHLTALAADKNGMISVPARNYLSVLAKGPVEIVPPAFQRGHFKP